MTPLHLATVLNALHHHSLAQLVQYSGDTSRFPAASFIISVASVLFVTLNCQVLCTKKEVTPVSIGVCVPLRLKLPWASIMPMTNTRAIVAFHCWIRAPVALTAVRVRLQKSRVVQIMPCFDVKERFCRHGWANFRTRRRNHFRLNRVGRLVVELQFYIPFPIQLTFLPLGICTVTPA